MSTIRCIFDQEPTFPATDQHPDAARYQVGGRWVDAIGGQPTQAEVDAILNPPPLTLDELESAAVAALNGGLLDAVDLRKLIKAVVVNFTARTLSVAPAAITPAQLATERARIAAIYKNL